MAEQIFRPGESQKLTLKLRENGADFDVTTAADIRVFLTDGTTIHEYQLNEAGGTGKVALGGMANEIDVFVEPAQSDTWKPGALLTATVEADMPDMDFPAGVKTVVFCETPARILNAC